MSVCKRMCWRTNKRYWIGIRSAALPNTFKISVTLQPFVGVWIWSSASTPALHTWRERSDDPLGLCSRMFPIGAGCWIGKIHPGMTLCASTVKIRIGSGALSCGVWLKICNPSVNGGLGAKPNPRRLSALTQSKRFSKILSAVSPKMAALVLAVRFTHCSSTGSRAVASFRQHPTCAVLATVSERALLAFASNH